jgi:hypothetical protein
MRICVTALKIAPGRLNHLIFMCFFEGALTLQQMLGGGLIRDQAGNEPPR